MKHDVEVALWGNLRPLVGGAETVTVQARNIRQMLEALVTAWPALEPIIEAGVSVAIDGRVYATSLTQPIPEGAEVVLMQRLKGG